MTAGSPAAASGTAPAAPSGAPAPTGTGNFVIEISYDSSVSTAPAGFQSTVGAAVAFFESHITTPMTITINVGFGETTLDGTTTWLASNVLGASTSTGIDVSYGRLRAALKASPGSSDQSTAAASLPSTNPTGGGRFYVAEAEAEALGLTKGPEHGGAVGAIGISGTQPLTYASTNGAAAGTYDALGVIEHEISEVLGRTSALSAHDGSGVHTPLDLFRYSSSGVRALQPGTGYFSIDGGNTALATFNDPAGSGGHRTGSGGDRTGSGGHRTGSGGDRTRSGGDRTGSGGDRTGSGGDRTGSRGHQTASGGTPWTHGADRTTSGGILTTSGDDPTNSGGTQTVSGGDAGDWATSAATPDSFNAVATQGTANPVSPTDLTVLNVLGYAVLSTSATTSANCFAAGSRIRTDRGDIPVEALAVGDRVLTRFSGLTPIRWIGRRRVDCRRHPDPELVRPLCIAAGAFAPGAPSRPLLLSPEHAVAVGDLLIPVRLLANGGSIAPAWHGRFVTYFHIELDRHDLLLAEGMEAESYLDTGNRALFDNAGPVLWLHPPAADATAQARRVALSCLPLCTDPAAVETVWRQLAARAVDLGFTLPAPATTDDPALCLGVGAARLAPVVQADGRAVFVVPPGAGPAVLLSRSMVPAALQPWIEDRRRLGVRVRHLALTRGAERIDLAPDDPSLVEGWWATERDSGAIWRWTNGAARLPLNCGGAVLEVWTAPAPLYPLAVPAPARAMAA